MSHTGELRASLQSTITARRWRQKIGRFVIAIGLGALLYFVALPQKWSPTIMLAIAVAIGYCISEDVMKALVKFLVAAVRDLASALPTKTPSNASPSAPPRVTPGPEP